MSEVRRLDKYNNKGLHWFFNAKGAFPFFPFKSLCVSRTNQKVVWLFFFLPSTCTHSSTHTAFCQSDTSASKLASCCVQVETLRDPSSLSTLQLSTVPGQKRLRATKLLPSPSTPVQHLQPQTRGLSPSTRLSTKLSNQFTPRALIEML